MEGVADPADIDTAMKLGTNYPAGPLAWADAIGADRIVAILEALQREYGEERYSPAVLLKQHAHSGRPFHIKETV
jgi:3-hydroxybutyryl-CoA dehydrogenase